ncbi:MAG TPA: FkbM family methyltransferase [Pyrinomonadaceae bacterium]|nr:FkbM family methyltransferase [Pyrinomonadaceae bacterium]
MNLKKILRIPKRLKDDIYIMSKIKNWDEVLSAKIKGSNIKSIKFRDGLIFQSPEEVRLEMLFHEVWVEEMYGQKGYEIKDNDTVLDIGANIGVFSIYAATRAKNVKVLAFEPFPENASWLKKNIELNELKNIQVFQKAVAGKSEPRVLKVEDAWVRHSLDDGNSETGLKIECISLDEVMGTIDKCDLMKIDCEGSEYEIFYSAENTALAKIKKIVGEYHQLDNQTKNGEALVGFLEEKNFIITDFQDFKNGTGSFSAKAK